MYLEQRVTIVDIINNYIYDCNGKECNNDIFM